MASLNLPPPQRALSTPSALVIGVDVGIENFATLSTGEAIPNPQYFCQAERRLKTAQRHVSRKKRGSHNRRKAARLLAQQHLKVKRQRLDFAHKTSPRLIREFDDIAVEELNIKGMVKNHHLAKSIVDAGWGTFLAILACKAKEAGRRVWKVPAVYTSQDCSACGARVRKKLATREHRCLSCGFVTHRDHNAALYINAWAKRLGMEQVAAPREPRTSPAETGNPRAFSAGRMSILEISALTDNFVECISRP